MLSLVQKYAAELCPLCPLLQFLLITCTELKTCTVVQTVRYRWLDESAPMKLSPLREALEAGKTLLGDEMPSLDLEAGPQPELPAIIPPPPDASEPAAGHDLALPEQEAAPDQDTAMPDVLSEQADAPAEDSMQAAVDNAVMVTVLEEAAPDLAVMPAPAADVRSPQAAVEPTAAGIEVPVLASSPLQRGSARGRSKARGRGAKGRSAGKGRKRKVASPTAPLLNGFIAWSSCTPKGKSDWQHTLATFTMAMNITQRVI